MHLDPDLHPDERYIPDRQTDGHLTSSKIEMLYTIGHFVAKKLKNFRALRAQLLSQSLGFIFYEIFTNVFILCFTEGGG